jgi:hypoxanthine phosphoribosyltransferase
MEKKYVSWDEIQKLINQYDVKGKYGEVDLVVSVGSGGMVPGLIIAKLLDKPVVNIGLKTYNVNLNEQTYVAQWYQKFDFKKSKHKKLLIVDDINDTGFTLATINSYLMSGFYTEEDVQYFTVFSKSKSYFRCDSAVEVPDDTWLVFPWEVQ